MQRSALPSRRFRLVKKKRREMSCPVATASKWNSVPMAPADPILGVAVAFNADPSPKKVNLGIGAYRTAEGIYSVTCCQDRIFGGDLSNPANPAGKPLVLRCIRAAEEKIVKDASMNKEYLPVQVCINYKCTRISI